MLPKISIITSSYNQGAYLESTIKSILDQGYPNLEYIIIDGGSTDNSVEIIKKYEKNITYWVSEKDKGVCDGINKGCRVSTGEIMGCINSDDMLHPKSLFTIAEIFSKFKEINWLLGATTIYDEIGRTVEVFQSRSVSRMYFFLEEMYFIQFESSFWRRGLWEKAGGKLDERIKYAGDFDLWMRFFQFDKLYITDALLGGFRCRSSNQLSLDNLDVYMQEVEQIKNRQVFDDQAMALLKKLKMLKKLLYYIRKTKLLNHSIITSRVIAKYNSLIGHSPRLRFDRRSQQFQL